MSATKSQANEASKSINGNGSPMGVQPATTFAEPLFSQEFSLEGLLERIPVENRELIRRAYDLAEKLHAGQKRSSGEPYITHPLAVATYLTDLNMDASSIAAGLLHDVLEDTEISRQEFSELFEEPVPEIVSGVTKISRINFHTNREAQVENLRIMILAMAKDIRVVIVKLCDRFHNMRTLHHLSPEKRLKISQETLDIYAPLANRLGMSQMKSELEDLAMRWIYPDDYMELVKMVSMKREEREQLLEESITMLNGTLKRHYPDRDLEISGRPKHFYSIYKKMQRQGTNFEEIYDLHAIRILCDTESQCYEVLGLIHSKWPPIPGRIKDYIGMPKKNMYQSLHTTVVGHRGMVTEIQIRTRAMHQIAEHGIAAHWKYKEFYTDQQLDEKLAWLRQLTEWITDVNEPDGLLDALKKDVFADRVLCFTPEGDVIELPADACPIDFAYAIHTKVGQHCIGAKINGRMVNLRSRLYNGDMVEIMTSTNGHPSRDWLDYAVTGRARSKIKNWLKTQNIAEWVENGRRSLFRLIDERRIDITHQELEKKLEELLPAYKMRKVEDLLVEIGFGSIRPQAALARLNPEWAKRSEPSVKKLKANQSENKKKSQDPVIIEGLEGCIYRVAQCCSPIVGEPIIAFVTRGRGVTIHTQTCSNIRRAKSDYAETERLLPARWNSQNEVDNYVRIQVEAQDRAGLLNDLTGVFRKHNAFILECTTKSNEIRSTAVLIFDAKVQNAIQFRSILQDIRTLQNVISAERKRK